MGSSETAPAAVLLIALILGAAVFIIRGILLILDRYYYRAASRKNLSDLQQSPCEPQNHEGYRFLAPNPYKELYRAALLRYPGLTQEEVDAYIAFEYEKVKEYDVPYKEFSPGIHIQECGTLYHGSEPLGIHVLIHTNPIAEEVLLKTLSAVREICLSEGRHCKKSKPAEKCLHCNKFRVLGC